MLHPPILLRFLLRLTYVPTRLILLAALRYSHDKLAWLNHVYFIFHIFLIHTALFTRTFFFLFLYVSGEGISQNPI